MQKKLIVSALLAAAGLLPVISSAADPVVEAASAAPASDWTIAGNAGLFSDYRFRGFTQTAYRPAFQGGIDISHSSGFYIGNWNSNVEQFLYRGASLEMDFYGGYKVPVGDFGLDVGYYYYYYPTKKDSVSNSYFGYNKQAAEGEVYFGVTYSTLSAKYYYGVTNFFGLGDSLLGGPTVNTKGSSYLDLSGTYDFGGGWGLAGHYGYQTIKNHEKFTDVDGNTLSKSVSDYRLGVTKDLSGWLVAATYIGTSKKGYFGTGLTFPEGGGKSSVVLSVGKTF